MKKMMEQATFGAKPLPPTDSELENAEEPEEEVDEQDVDDD